MSRADHIEACLRELLRLYDWRFELAKQQEEGMRVRHLLNQYGIEKKAAWQLARVLLAK